MFKLLALDNHNCYVEQNKIVHNLLSNCNVLIPHLTEEWVMPLDDPPILTLAFGTTSLQGA